MYLNRKTWELSQAKKPEDHDVAVSAHMIIDFSMQPAHRFGVALEDHEGISRTAIVRSFQELLRTCTADIVAVTETGNSKQGPARVNLDSYAGRRIRDADVTVKEIELVQLQRHKAVVAESSDPFYQTTERRLFKPRKGLIGKIKDLAIEFATRLKKEHPDHLVRIVWRDPANREPDAVTQIEPEQHPDQLLDRALSRMLKIDGFTNLPNASQTVVERLRVSMLEGLRKVLAEERGTS